MAFHKIIKYGLLLLLCACLQATKLSAQIMAHGSSQSLSGTASAAEVKSPPSIASDEKSVGGVWMSCWATPTGIYVSTSTNAGDSWSGAQQIVAVSELTIPSIATNKSGKWFIAWRDKMDIKLITSSNNGGTWSTASIISTSPNNAIQNISDPVIETSGNGLWKIVWGAASSSSWAVNGATSQDNGANWSDPILIKSHEITTGVLTGINHVILQANTTDNWISAWTLQERTVDINTSSVTDQTSLWSATCDGNGWTTAQIVAQNSSIKTPSLASDTANNWLLVWEEESFDVSTVLQHNIYQTSSSDNGINWTSKQIIQTGKSPFIAHFEGTEFALAFVDPDSRSFMDFGNYGGRPISGSDDDIIMLYSKDSGASWISPQIGNTYGLTDDGDFATGNWISDAHPVLAKNTNGAWVLAWVKSYAMNNQVYSEIFASTLDSSPPYGEVTSDYGDSTIRSTSLSFTRSDFAEDQSNFSHYQWAFGNETDPEAYKAFPFDNTVDENVPLTKTIIPSDIPTYLADFSMQGFFSKGKYVYTVRAFNDLGTEIYNASSLYREVSACVKVIPVKIGEDIPLPDGKVWADINWSATTFTPTNHAVLVESAERFIAADHGALAVNWVYTTGGTLAFNYDVAPAAFKTPMILYHTHEDNSQQLTNAPSVDVSNIVPNLIIHYNQTIPAETSSTTDFDPFWEAGGSLFARGTATRDFHYIVLQYNNPDGSLMDFETVLLKPDVPDVEAGIIDIGSRILPFAVDVPLSTSCSQCPQIVNGVDKLYMHDMVSSPQYKHIWGIKKSTQLAGIAIFWKREGLGQVVWPFEYRRYTTPNWPTNPTKYQTYVRGPDAANDGKTVTIPSALNPTLTGDQEPVNSAFLNGNIFHTNEVGMGEGWSILRYIMNNWVGFEVVKSIPRTSVLSSGTATIGLEITDEYHEGAKLGAYIYQSEGDKYAIDIQAETGQVFGVNKGNLEVWWSNLSRTTDPEGDQYPTWPTAENLRVQWSSKVVAYDVGWETTPAQIIIATQKGSGVIDPAIYGTDWEIYVENDNTKAGFNPNDEHALTYQSEAGKAIFPLRDDLGSAATSEPYVLMQYKEQPATDLWRFKIFQVIRETPEFPFSNWASLVRPLDRYEGNAGKLIQSPFPISTLYSSGYPAENEAISGPFFEDKNGFHWAKAAGNDGVSTADIVMRYYYPIQADFYTGTLPNETTVGTQVPWLDDGTGTPVNVTYTIHWPTDVPTMKIGQTLLEAQLGLPAIDGQCSVDLLYEQSVANGTVQDRSVLLIDPIQERAVNLVSIPTAIKAEGSNTEMVFTDLTLAIRRRIYYNKDNTKLIFRGERVSPVIGFDYALLNVMSAREKAELLALSSEGAWVTAVNSLYNLTKDPIIINNSSEDPYDLLALSSGLAKGVGFVTLAMQNGDQCGNLPISLEIIKVIPELETNGLAVITPTCPFDETLTLRHTGDFGGASDGVKFEWQSSPDEGGIPPAEDAWITFTPTPTNGTGAIDNTIAGPGLLTLSDNWIRCRYTTTSSAYLPNTQSEWTPAQLAPGWIKRVVGEINAFSQRASGGGIEGAEGAFFDFGEKEVNTIVSMLRQSGARWVGNVPLNCDNIDDFGLIEIYETILGRGIDLSIEGIPSVDYPPANNALLLVASRIADMYTLMGNEAFADAADPTIAFSTEDGTYGTQASSIHSFQNQTASLIEEELGLLRGRDATNAPSVGLHPVYNKLYWNFTNGDGEVAYAANYDIQDQTGNLDGMIDEADAKLYYPQGHGDAWGHYLMATKVYYKLLQHPNYTWKPRSEGILLGGQPITVDYFDERKFAKAAAAKAKTGAEIVDLTYRSVYVEDPAGQWQGYKDNDTDRAWGFDEWADRSGQAAYFDWMVGNAILPAEDETHTGIQKIDRTTVLEWREVANSALEIQAQVDEANRGLNPLGLATNVVPFDISPTEIDAGKTHFEQVYDRAITSMKNATTVFNHATNSTQLLRRQNNDQQVFAANVEQQEGDFENRLIEIFGYPYPDDIGPGKTYPTGYTGYDKYHFNYVDAAQLMLQDLPATIEVPVYFKETTVDANGGLMVTDKIVQYQLSNSADQFGEIKPSDWTGQRRAPGEIQMTRSNLIQTYGRLKQALAEYNNLQAEIKGQVGLLKAQYDVNAADIKLLNEKIDKQETLSIHIIASNIIELQLRTVAESILEKANGAAEALPTSVGLSSDPSSVARGGLKISGSIAAFASQTAANIAATAQLRHEQAIELAAANTELKLTTNEQNQEILAQVATLQELVRSEVPLRLELYSLEESIRQAIGEYNAVLAEGIRTQEDLALFRRQTAANVQSRRYKDMTFRIFRNDALQKYRAQYDLAARYVYLAAKAYDYETTLLSGSNSGKNFLTDIIKQRLIGTLNTTGSITTPQTGQGLANPMRQMSDNFSVFKGQLGFNNPQQETNRFSLRSELFRIGNNPVDDETWRNKLREYVVDDVFAIPEFRRYCNPFTSNPLSTGEPAIVIPFSSTITFGLNFFGNELKGGDHAYSESNFTTKVRSVGTWFSNYSTLQQNGLSATPRVYLIPVGADIQRSPSNNNSGEIREFRVLDQLIPAPFTNISGADLANPNWIPIADNLGASFAESRQFSDFRAYHDSGSFDENQAQRDSRLIGRSVWNTRWLLIIPAGTLLGDRMEGLNRFIDGQLVGGTRNGSGISDIKIFFETYAFPGF